MRTLYNLEYSVVDKLNRSKKKYHVGVFKSEDEVEQAKTKILSSLDGDDGIMFTVYISENIF